MVELKPIIFGLIDEGTEYLMLMICQRVSRNLVENVVFHVS